MQLPKFIVSKDIPARGITRVGTIRSTYNEISKRFGPPTLSEAAGDSFDGFESVVWKIKFENNLIAEISDLGEFGKDKDYRSCEIWAIHGHNQQVVQYIKKYLGIK